MPKLTDDEIQEFEKSFDQPETVFIAKAENFRKTSGPKNPAPDPFLTGNNEIAPSLLSADDIARYVFKTGMIYPFSTKERENKEKAKGDNTVGLVHRLKQASYEGRIGKAAYVYGTDKNEPRAILGTEDETLLIPANSIVFVECDLYFRLPPFIAVRFNLQIRHVHRGLLLGTGPLVDPGFWGKLCIPLHNLTDRDYEIPLDEGLIWVEFTKTTSDPTLGKVPSNSDLNDIKSSLDKSSQPYKAVLDSFRKSLNQMTFLDTKNVPTKVGIRSSIQGSIHRANEAVSRAKKVQKSNLLLTLSGMVGIVFGAITILNLYTSYQANVSSLVLDVRNDITGLKVDYSEITGMEEKLLAEIASQKATIELLEIRLNELEEALPVSR